MTRELRTQGTSAARTGAPAGPAIRWLGGDPRDRAMLEPVLLAVATDGDDVELLREKSGRRRLLRAPLREGAACFIKQFPANPGRHRLREWFKHRLGLGTDRREWRSLTRLHAAGVAVPEPLAHAVLPGGDRVVVTRFVAGRSVDAALAGSREERIGLLRALGKLVGKLHAEGWVHRDLHRENLLVGSSGPVLVDLQLALPLRTRRGRLRDLGELDRSLADLVSLGDRIRLRAAALGLSRPFAPAAREALRAVGKASRERALAHYESRTRRSLREGRLYARIDCDGGRGLRLRETAEEVIAAAIDARPGDSELHVERWSAGGLAAVGSSLWRGSPARRAWRAGHGLRARGIPAGVPLAFLERRVLGLPVRSTLVVAPLPPGPSLVEAVPDEPLAHALADLSSALHARGVRARQLGAAGLRVDERGGAPEILVADLAGVDFRRRESDARRIEELAQLDASLPERFPDPLRRAAFDRYTRRLPFAGGTKAALHRLVGRSRTLGGGRSGARCAPASAGAVRPSGR